MFIEMISCEQNKISLKALLNLDESAQNLQHHSADKKNQGKNIDTLLYTRNPKP